MIGWLSGKVVEILGRVVILNVNGVGYEIIASRRSLADAIPDNPLTLIIYTDVQEDSIRLYGFADRVEREVFELLLQVKGVGAKSASEILSKIDRIDLLRVIGSEDPSGLQAVPRVGRKLAERIIVELKDKVGSFALERQAFSSGLSSDIEVQRTVSKNEPYRDAVEALQSLGFGRREAEAAVSKVPKNHQEAANIVREALRFV